MSIESRPGIAILTPRTGGGKDAFQNSIVPHLEYSPSNPSGRRVDIVEPSMTDTQTRALWFFIRTFYWAAARSDLVAKRYGSIHSGSNKLRDAITTLGSRDFMKIVNERGDIPFTLHGLLGKGNNRYFAEGDVIPEASAADSKTVSFVPLEETKSKLQSFGETKEVNVVGFIVPDELKDYHSVLTRQENFEEGKPVHLAFMATGQLSPKHLEFFYKKVLYELSDEIMAGRLKISAYTWKSMGQALEVKKRTQEVGLSVLISDKFIKDSTCNVQVYFNLDPDKAAKLSFRIGAASDLILTGVGERLPWTSFVPLVGLPPIPGNIKMMANYQWGVERNVVIPAPQDFRGLVNSLYANSGLRIREHYERSAEVFKDGETLNGAKLIADYLKEVDE